MSDELELWQSQSAESVRLTAGELEKMEKKMRRAIYDFYAAVICIAIVVVGIAALFRNVTLTIGAVLTLCGFGFLTYEVISSLRGMPSPVDASIDYQRALTRNRIEIWHGKLAQRVPVRANRALAVLSSFLTWLEHDHRIDHNPCKSVRKRSESPRQVFLSAKEIAAAHKALKAHNDRSAALTLRLTLLTGCRIGEALKLAPDQIDSARKVWVKPAAYVKTSRTHIIPLQAEARDVAKQLLDVGVPTYDGVRIVWERVKEIIGRPECRIHDLRHSRASSLARAGASLVEIGAVLGHTNLVSGDLVALVERAR